tara:strand:+ start:227 stop:802 length:576 start_codon:yes stop_codon:yes gene_type:complete
MIIWSTNKIFDDDLLDPIIVDLKNHPTCYSPKAKYYTSYFTPDYQRPERGLVFQYKDILDQAFKDLTLYKRIEYDLHKCISFWMQLYPQNGGTITSHHHYTEKNIFSWVHFLRPSSKKCFHFINHNGNKVYPENQKPGDFIVFPSWALHAVDVNTDESDRVVVSGNVGIDFISESFVKRSEERSKTCIVYS